MITKKCLLATISGFVVMFLLGWLGHDLILPGLYEANPMEALERSEPIVLGIAAAYLVLAALMAYIYPKGIEGTSVLGNGIRFGVVIGLIFSLPISLIFYSVYVDISLSMVVSEAVWHMIEQGLGGVVIAYVYGIESAASSEPEL